MLGDHYCSCKSDVIDINGKKYQKPWRIHVTKVDKEGKCTNCGYYAAFMSDKDYNTKGVRKCKK